MLLKWTWPTFQSKTTTCLIISWLLLVLIWWLWIQRAPWSRAPVSFEESTRGEKQGTSRVKRSRVESGGKRDDTHDTSLVPRLFSLTRLGAKSRDVTGGLIRWRHGILRQVESSEREENAWVLGWRDTISHLQSFEQNFSPTTFDNACENVAVNFLKAFRTAACFLVLCSAARYFGTFSQYEHSEKKYIYIY